MMSPALVAFVGVIYGYIAVEQFYLENPGMGICYFGYAVANIGMWFLVK
jgi:TM2 domain-containing membrane protein YozV